MDVRQIFTEASKKPLSDFESSATSVKHAGGRGSVREEAFAELLAQYLPRRYRVGKGEVFNSQNRTSGQLDVILFDEESCPTFLSSKSHAAYPIESVYGAISVKSNLTSGELENAYDNIKSFKEIAPEYRVQHSNSFGQPEQRMPSPVPVTGIFAYTAKRSLNVIVKQISELDNSLPHIFLRPDFVAILNRAIIGPSSALRGPSNLFRLYCSDQPELRKTGKHTLFLLWMDLYRELRTIILSPFDFAHYRRMPKLIGNFRVEHCDVLRLGRTRDEHKLIFINTKGIKTVLGNSKQLTVREVEMHVAGQPPSAPHSQDELDEVAYEYNPRGLPLRSEVQKTLNPDTKQLKATEPYFNPLRIEIDEKIYGVDIGALPKNCFDEVPDLTFDEIIEQLFFPGSPGLFILSRSGKTRHMRFKRVAEHDD
jgi:hypothetical protein